MPTRRVEKCVSGLSLAPTANGWKSFFFLLRRASDEHLQLKFLLPPPFQEFQLFLDSMVKFYVIKFDPFGDKLKF
jgi:hypothetical protein